MTSFKCTHPHCYKRLGCAQISIISLSLAMMYKRNHISSVCMRHIQIKHFHVSIGVESRWTNQQITNKNDDWHVPSCFGPQCYFRPGHSCEIIHAGYAALESLSRLKLVLSYFLRPWSLHGGKEESGSIIETNVQKTPHRGLGPPFVHCVFITFFFQTVCGWQVSILSDEVA